MNTVLSALRYLTILLAFMGIYGIYRVSRTTAALESTIPDAPPQAPPDRPYDRMIAASGIVESFQENVIVSTPIPGLVTEVPVKVGQVVKKGELLFQLDARDFNAQLLAAEATIGQAEASIKVAEAQKSRAQSIYDRLNRITDKRVIIEQDLQASKDDLAISEAQLGAATAERAAAQAHVASIRLQAQRLSVCAPRDGTILQLHIRAGEWAGTDAKSPSLILGRTDQLQVRVDVDEQNALRIRNNQKATAYIKGDREHAIDLKLEYIEPFVVPKTSLTGASTERVDTRVLQVIFSFTPPKHFTVYVGQQIDAFIEE